MSLAEFVESLILSKFDCIPAGHVRMNPSIHPEIPRNIGEVKQLGFVGKARFYADPAIPKGQVRFINAVGKITILLPKEKKEEEVESEPPAKKPRKKKPGRKRKARSV